MTTRDLAGLLREAATDALRYWEPRRLVYNGVLAAIVLWYFSAAWPESGEGLSLNGFLFVVLLAVLANVAYCAIYLADVFVQISGFRAVWVKMRWLLLVVGTLFAGIITRFWSLAFFGPPGVLE